jgi:riboflavin biosynthesis pyrimidine reductase
MRLVRTIFDLDQDGGAPLLPRGLRELYDGHLHFTEPHVQRPFVIANFVSTLDGIVSYKVKGHSSGSTISGSDPGDRFIMGLLRASADAIMVGARTVHDVSPKDLWIPEYTYPAAKHLYTAYRSALHKSDYPLVVILSASGKLELRRAIFRTPGVTTVVITTPQGRDELVRAGVMKLRSVQMLTLDATEGRIAPRLILRVLSSQFGVRTLLHEGGPTLFGQFLAAKAVDELFVTLSPQIAGRKNEAIRPALVEGVQFVPDRAPWFQILSVKQKADHLYLRYRRLGGRKPELTSERTTGRGH